MKPRMFYLASQEYKEVEEKKRIIKNEIKFGYTRTSFLDSVVV